MLNAVLALMIQLASAPPGEPPAQLHFVYLDRVAAVYVDDAFTRQDAAGPALVQSRSLHVPFDTGIAPYWLTERHDCAGRSSQAVWRESAIELMHDGREAVTAAPTAWTDRGPGAPATVGATACEGSRQPASTPLTPDEAMNAAYQLPLEIRFQPAIYGRTGDLGETLDFIGLDGEDVGWFVEPRSPVSGEGGATIDVLTISGRAEVTDRFAWQQLRFDCSLSQVVVLQGQLYAEGPTHIRPIPVSEPPAVVTMEADSLLARVRRYACDPSNPPELRFTS